MPRCPCGRSRDTLRESTCDRPSPTPLLSSPGCRAPRSTLLDRTPDNCRGQGLSGTLGGAGGLTSWQPPLPASRGSLLPCYGHLRHFEQARAAVWTVSGIVSLSGRSAVEFPDAGRVAG